MRGRISENEEIEIISSRAHTQRAKRDILHYTSGSSYAFRLHSADKITRDNKISLAVKSHGLDSLTSPRFLGLVNTRGKFLRRNNFYPGGGDKMCVSIRELFHDARAFAFAGDT